MQEDFPHLTSRLRFIEFCPDQLKNLELWICLSEFESYVYGVVSQYSRISENLPKTPSVAISSFSLTQLSLDIYFYTLAWDKLKKVLAKIKQHVNTLAKTSNSIPASFVKDFKSLRSRMEHLFGEFQSATRNEYEHPSLQPSRIGNLLQFGTLIQDHHGDIKAHIGKEEYAIVRKYHVDRLNSLWIELVDVFVRHFMKKASTSDLLLLKKYIEENRDAIVAEYRQLREEGKDKEANQLLHQVLMSDLYLSGEGIPLRQDVKESLYSSFIQGNAAQQSSHCA